MKLFKICCLLIAALALFSCPSPNIDNDEDESKSQAASGPGSFKQTGKTTNSLTFIWNPVKDAVSYTIYKHNIETGNYEKIPDNVVFNSFTDTGLEIATTYNYKVGAVFSGGDESELSSAVSCVTALPSPSNFSLVTKDEFSIQIKWDELADADNTHDITGYELYRMDSNAESKGYRLIADILFQDDFYFDSNTNTYQYTDTKNLVIGISYKYALKVKNAITDCNLTSKLDINLAANATEITKIRSYTGPDDIHGTTNYYDFELSSVTGAYGYNIYKYDTKDAIDAAIQSASPDPNQLLRNIPVGTTTTGEFATLFTYYGVGEARTPANSGKKYYVTAAALFGPDGGTQGKLFESIEVITTPHSPEFADTIDLTHDVTLPLELAYSITGGTNYDGFKVYYIAGLEYLRRARNTIHNNSHWDVNQNMLTMLNTPDHERVDEYDYLLVNREIRRDARIINYIEGEDREYTGGSFLYTYNQNLNANDFYMFYLTSFVEYSSNNKSQYDSEESEAIHENNNSRQVCRIWTTPLPAGDLTADLNPENNGKLQDIRFTWTNPNSGDNNPNGHGFEYHLILLHEGDPTGDPIANQENREYNVSDLEPFKTYTLQVKVINTTTGLESASASTEITTGLENPKNVTSETGYDIVQLTWDVVDLADGYNIYRNGTKLNNTLIPKDAPEFIETGLSHDITATENYTYEITAVVDINGLERESSTTSFTATTKALIPPVINNSISGMEFIELHWNDATTDGILLNGNSVAYSISWSTDVTDDYNGTIDATTDMPVTISGLPHSTEFDFTIKTVYDNGDTSTDSAVSPVYSVSTYTLETPARPSADKWWRWGELNITIRWDEIPNAAGYIIYRERMQNSENDFKDISTAGTVDANTFELILYNVNHWNNQQLRYRVEVLYDITIPEAAQEKRSGPWREINVP